jgi:D-alanyl-D-alanine dipeptidase
MLHIWVHETLHDRVSECFKLRLRKIKSLEKLAIHHLLYELAHFRILDAYRPIAVQQALWDHYRAQFRAEMPDLTEEELDMHTRTCVSMPSYDVLQPSIHNTGGAVDLTIIGPDGEPLDMGTTFDAFSDATWTDYFETEDILARKNRRMLYNVMTAAGFTNLPSEWWHYDYGDNMWAQLTGSKAIYAGILDADVRGKVL